MLDLVAVSGLAVFFVAQLVRALPWPLRWMMMKPLACDVCMSGWGAILLWTLSQYGVVPLLNVRGAAAAAGISFLLMKVLERMVPWGPPPS